MYGRSQNCQVSSKSCESVTQKAALELIPAGLDLLPYGRLLPYIYYFFYILTHVLLTPISEDQKEAVKICRCPPCVEKRESLRKKEPKSKSIRYVR